MHSEQECIEVIGAREHNLQDIDVTIPKNKLVVITGISGSGKSSLAFDTIYSEGQRRYMETFSAYARQFIGKLERPNVEQINGLSPVISIEQKTAGWNPRSTVGTITEIYDFLRLLFARVGTAYSYESGKRMIKFSEEAIVKQILEDYQNKRVVILAPMIRARKGHYRELFDQIRKQGYTKARVDGKIVNIEPGFRVERFKTHDIEIVVDRLNIKTQRRDRLAASLTTALKLGNGFIQVMDHDSGQITPFSKQLMDPETGLSYEEPSPHSFSFNSPYGACPVCSGLGQTASVDPDKVIPDDKLSIHEGGIAPFGEVRNNFTFKQLRIIAKKFNFSFTTPICEIPKQAMEIILNGGDESFDIQMPYSKHDFTFNLPYDGLYKMIDRWYRETSSDKIRKWAEDFMSISSCEACAGQRLKKESLHFKIGDKNISELARLDLQKLADFFNDSDKWLNEKQNRIAKDILKEIKLRLRFLLHVGLDYLSLDRPAKSLSGGESQRTRLANQIGSQLTGITYILDEPSIGLHQRDNRRLIQSLKELIEIGNTVIVVEHDKEIMMSSDFLIDLGPGAGIRGGKVVGSGQPDVFIKSGQSLTASYLRNSSRIQIPNHRRNGNEKFLVLKGARGNNLKNVTLKIPLGTFTCITGVSGSGKSSLINETLYPILRKHFYRSQVDSLPYMKIIGQENIDKVIEINQAPIGRTPRSNPVTYTGVFTEIRKLFSDIPESKIRGYKPGRFSFNVAGGRCETCQGGGKRVIEMNFLPDVHVDCEQCMGKRYNRETLEIHYKGKSISDVLELTVSEAVDFFRNIPKIFQKIKTLQEVGLGYIHLGQQATTLSGGEAQRVKLAEELSKKDTGNTLYILDEPTTGLHFDDIRQLLIVLNKLVDKGNTVIVIEHNLDVIKVADHIIDIGPEGGDRGGKIVAQGTPEQICKKPKSYTGQYLKGELRAIRADKMTG